MKSLVSIGCLTVLLLLVAQPGAALKCEREGFFGQTDLFNCPQPTDDPEDTFCCGTKKNPYCCDTPFGVDDEVLKEITEKLPVILGVIGALILGLLVLCIVCCCCCPFCLLHKRRNRGTVHNPNTADVTVTQPLQPMQPGPQYQVQQPYPPQPYPQPYPPSQPYPPQGYPAQPGYPQQPMPLQPDHPGVYPVDQPPPYSEKQLPYNPNYQE